MIDIENREITNPMRAEIDAAALRCIPNNAADAGPSLEPRQKTAIGAAISDFREIGKLIALEHNHLIEVIRQRGQLPIH